MGQKIEDGTGKGFQAKVNSDNTISIKGPTFPLIEYISEEKGLAFVFALKDLFVTSTNEVAVGYFQNTESDKAFHIQHVHTFSDGAAAGTGSCIIRYYFNMTEPSGNNTAATPVNMNSGASTQPSAVSYKASVGGGMTVSSNGTFIFADQTSGKSSAAHEPDGALIIAPGKSFGVTVQCSAQPMVINIHMSGYFEDVE